MKHQELIYLEPEWQMLEGDDQLCFRHMQRIDESWLEEQRRAKAAEAVKAADIMPALTVPCIFIEKWLREGKDYFRADIKERVRWLHEEDLTDFIVTNKRL